MKKEKIKGLEKEKPALVFTQIDTSIYSFFTPSKKGDPKPKLFLTIDLDSIIYINLHTNIIGTIAGHFGVEADQAKFIEKIWKAYLVS